jgi:DNA excision repair protein ERCC-5
MGVHNLWELLAPCGRHVSIETLEGKVMAIDVSLWLTQFLKAMRDDDGNMIRNAHLIGMIRRILKLLFHRIRPVFVFDGATPALKLKTVRARRSLREKQENSKRVTAQKIFLSQLKQQELRNRMNPAPAADEGQYASCFRPPGAASTNGKIVGDNGGGGEDKW